MNWYEWVGNEGLEMNDLNTWLDMKEWNYMSWHERIDTKELTEEMGMHKLIWKNG